MHKKIYKKLLLGLIHDIILKFVNKYFSVNIQKLII